MQLLGMVTHMAVTLVGRNRSQELTTVNLVEMDSPRFGELNTICFKKSGEEVMEEDKPC